MKALIVTLSLILIVSGLGCAALSHYITPASIDQGAVGYAVDAGTAEPNDYTGYPNLLKANRLQSDVDSAHSIIQLALQQQAQQDNLNYSIHKDVVSSNLIVAAQREEMLFGEKGLLSLGLSMAGAGSLAGFVGLMRKRPGDVTVDDLNRTVAQATGKTNGELMAKNKQFVEVVRGVKAFMDTWKDKDPETILAMKAEFNRVQDTDTRVAVATVLKTT